VSDGAPQRGATRERDVGRPGTRNAQTFPAEKGWNVENVAPPQHPDATSENGTPAQRGPMSAPTRRQPKGRGHTADITAGGRHRALIGPITRTEAGAVPAPATNTAPCKSHRPGERARTTRSRAAGTTAAKIVHHPPRVKG